MFCFFFKLYSTAETDWHILLFFFLLTYARPEFIPLNGLSRMYDYFTIL